ncbi:AI-2E family transporter [Erythrobacteraceae bacterium CFH 75059]|uniref:AI-2E family transporter n=1 Tax=Qipengyuania thermophila TaxID=2509361 RepID=UPI00102107D0|nr:AI-2E family transporter [Qipengyuania thermophila]TCD05265.1 AI-2E family transporter [Erythrobacteraceae bacterium CFH 75059]
MIPPRPQPLPASIVLRNAAIWIGLVIFVLLVWQIRHVLLLVFASILFALLFRAGGSSLCRATGMPYKAGVSIVIVLFLGVIGLFGFLFGSEVSRQVREIEFSLPLAWRTIENLIGDYSFGEQLLAQIEDALPSGSAIFNTFSSIVAQVVGALSTLLLVLVGGIFLALQPRMYRAGMLKLVPRPQRELAGDAVENAGNALKLWLLAQLGVMVIVGVLTGLGLWLLGVPGALVLGLLAGVLEFVPYAGPILAAIPGLLIASTQGWDTLLWTLGLYVVIQQLEGNVIMPLIQKWAVELPPALTLFSLVAFGGIFGVAGLLLAVPLTVLLFVFVKQLYVRETLNEETEIPGEDTEPDAAEPAG